MKKVLLFAVALFSAIICSAQTQPNLENGWKPFGSYDGSDLDSVNLQNGNLILHIPMPFSYPQRGGKLAPRNLIHMSSKAWSVAMFVTQNGSFQYWSLGFGPAAHVARLGSGLNVTNTMDMSLHRVYEVESGAAPDVTASDYYLTTWDGGTHQLHAPSNATLDGHGIPLSYDAIDNSGYHVELTNADPTTGVPTSGYIIDRAGNRYQIGSYKTVCGQPSTTGFFSNNPWAAPLRDEPFGVNAEKLEPGFLGQEQGGSFELPPGKGGNHYQNDPPPDATTSGGTSFIVCQQAARISSVTDVNGNVFNTVWNSTPADTMGRNPNAVDSGTDTLDFNGCVSPSSSIPISSATIFAYQGFGGAGNPLQVKICYANFPIFTNFSQPNVSQYQNTQSYANGITTLTLIASLVFSDAPNWTGTRWSFNYDTYLNVTDIHLPTGGSIHYDWTETAPGDCGSPTKVSRAVSARTFNDNNGNSSRWTYSWGLPSAGQKTNIVTDPLYNDTVHLFTALEGSAGCHFYETTTKYFQGPSGGGTLLKQVDTSYTAPKLFGDVIGGNGGFGDIFPTSITTKIQPGGANKVSMVTRSYDAGPGNDRPIFGNLVSQQETDWGSGSPGAPLRQTETAYQWQQPDGTGTKRYLLANLPDLPARTVVKDASGCMVSETTFGYDEASVASSGLGTAQQLGPPPNPVRGNQTSVNHWLAPLSSSTCVQAPAVTAPVTTPSPAVTSTALWFDSGTLAQATDPGGHATTHSYHGAYWGAYSTTTCSPSTTGASGQVAHCVSGTYDFTTALLTSFTNENASQAANGNAPGDAQHTTNYTYDPLTSRLSAVTFPTDPSNGNAPAQTLFTYSPPNVFPMTLQRQKSITAGMMDSVTTTYDGLGRVIKTQHATPNGPATVDTTYDELSRVASVSNPYFTTSDPTYGVTYTQYDALDRVTQVAPPDGTPPTPTTPVTTCLANNVCTSYNANATTATDQAGNQRRTVSDALGRLVEVGEPGVVAGHTLNNHSTLQTDGNFVVYDPANVPLWNSGTSGTNVDSARLQDDGNFVLYGMVWLAGTYTAPNGVVYSYDSCRIGQMLYASLTMAANTCLESSNGRFKLLMQSDGNLVIYDRSNGAATWGSGTYGHPGAWAIMQTDGNLVVYAANGAPLWGSGTYGTGASVADMRDDGRLTIEKDRWDAQSAQPPVSGVLAPPACNVGNGLGWTGQLQPGQCLVSPNGHYQLLMQTDGNVVLSDIGSTPARTLWSAGTGLTPLSPGVAMQTLYSYDALGNLLCVEQHGDSPAGSHGDGTAGTGCSADPSNDPTSTWRVRRFTYDSFSRLLTAKNPEAGTITYAYDVDSNMISKTDARGITISYSPAALPIDELHRVRKKTYSNGDPAVTFTYDSAPGVTNAIGKLVSLTDPAGSASYSYDQLGRLSGESRMIFGSGSNQITKSLSYSYNLDGSLKSLTYPSGAVVTYTPDSAGRILSAVDSGHSISYATAATYQADGQMTAFVSGNAINNAFTYNKRLQPINMSAIAPSLPPPNQTVFSVGYNFHLGNGNNGNVYGITNYKDANRNQTFTYDPLNRLISAQNTGTDCNAITVNGKTKYWGNNYVYDAWGNLYQKNVTKCGAENLGITILNNNRIGTAGYGYDASGNMTANATDGVTATFDAESRIATALKSGVATAYVYDSDGNRVKKTNGSNDTLYWYMTPGIVAESDLSGTTKSEYIFFNGERVARRDGVNGTGGVFYYFSDHLKTASVVTDATGNIKAESDYYPWGGELQLVNADSNHYKFTGKERDSETGLDYFGARYYSNGLGRWVSADWSATPVPVPYADYSNPQSLGLYGFVGGNPASKADPDGHCWPIGECAHNVMNAVDRAQAKLQAKAEATGIPAVAAATTFATGVTRDVVNGFVGLGTVGEASGAAWNGSTTERIVAAAEDGGKVGGIILTVVAVAGPKSTAPAGDTLKPGPHVGDGVPASGPRIKAAEQRAVNAEGAQNGCHTCGAQSPGTKSGNWVGDHQPATALNSSGAPQTLYPQCLSCMRRQGGQVTAAVRAGGGQQQTPKPVLPVPTKKPGEN